MKLVLDMNLSPGWVPTLGAAGHDAIHWTSVGDSAATDAAIMGWARSDGRIVITQDLGFAALLAHAAADGPSVVLLRTNDALPESLGSRLLAYLGQFAQELEAGAIVVIDPDRARARVLPLRG